jgi:hypothetical protein
MFELFKITCNIKKITFVLFIISSIGYAQVEHTMLDKIKSIKCENNFIQTSISTKNIDLKIFKSISEQVSKNILNEEIETTINYKKLKYLGFIHPNKTGLFNANPISTLNKNTPELDKKLHVFNYDDFYISTEINNKQNRLNIYYTLRAINILKVRYKELYNVLFKNSKKFATKKPNYANWVNSNKAFWIAFNNNPTYIASNNTIFLGDGYFLNSTIGKYRNVALVNIDSENILGKSQTIGSRPIYNQEKNSDNHLKYLKDGLIESITHEMLHNYIDLAYSYKESINKIKTSRANCNFKYAEENTVLNTSLSYFIKKGGLHKKLIEYYYLNTFDFNIETLRRTNQLNEFSKVFTKSFKNKTWKDIFKLKLLD